MAYRRVLQRDELGLGQHQAFLSALDLQPLEPCSWSRCHTQRTPAVETVCPRPPQFVGDEDLAEGRLPDSERNDSVLDLL